MNVKHVNVYSLSVILFFRSCIETSIDSNRSWNKTTNVSTCAENAPGSVHGGGWTMVEKMTVWKTHVQLLIHSNASVELQRITFLGFKFDLRFLGILKLLHIYVFGVLFCYCLYSYFISGQCSLFIPKYRSKESEKPMYKRTARLFP